jgi:hypothetical protein
MNEPENLVLQLLRDIREDIGDLDRKIDKQGNDLRAELRSERHSLRADVASDLMTMEKRLDDQLIGLRRSVMEYHSSAVDHGLLLSEFEERLRRVEQRLDIVPPESH